ncbi:SRR1-like protein isoform X3 [Oratosquilla oratoria]
MEADGFVVVSRKKRAKARKLQTLNPIDCKQEIEEVDIEGSIRKIVRTKEDIHISDSLQLYLKSLKEVVLDFGEQRVVNIISFGLGHVSACRIARNQLAVLLLIKDALDSPPTEVYDPVFSKADKHVLKEFGLNVSEENEEGKRRITCPTLFYMPHCGKALYNNLLWANWTLSSLANCIIIGNSFATTVQNVPKNVMEQRYWYIDKAVAHCCEVPMESLVSQNDVFNDTSMHVFPSHLLPHSENEIWRHLFEPKYEGEELEIITEQKIASHTEH